MSSIKCTMNHIKYWIAKCDNFTVVTSFLVLFDFFINACFLSFPLSVSHGQASPTSPRTLSTASSRWILMNGWLLARHLNTLGLSAWLLPPPWRTCSDPFPRTSWREHHHAVTALNRPNPLVPGAPRNPAKRGAYARKSWGNSTGDTSSSAMVD